MRYSVAQRVAWIISKPIYSFAYVIEKNDPRDLGNVKLRAGDVGTPPASGSQLHLRFLSPVAPQAGVDGRCPQQREVELQQYRVFFFNDAGQVCGVSAALFDDEESARQWARSLDDGLLMELWSPDHEIRIDGPNGDGLTEARA